MKYRKYSVLMLIVSIFWTLGHSDCRGMVFWHPERDDGFNNADNVNILPTVEYEDELYIGVFNSQSGGEVWKTDDGKDWDCVMSGGFGNAANIVPWSGAVYKDNIYFGTGNLFGFEVYRSDNGSDWEKVGEGGLGSASSTKAMTLTEFEGDLYLGTSNFETGAQLFRTSDGENWDLIFDDGFGDPDNVIIYSLVEFNDYLYAGTRNDATGLEIWRTDDGEDWERVVNQGLDDADNWRASEMIVYEDALYCGTHNETGGAEILRTEEGENWSSVVTEGWGDEETVSVFSMASHNSTLYAGVLNEDKGGMVWETQDGTEWTCRSEGGFGNAANIQVSILTSFNGRLIAGTRNPEEGCEIWTGRNVILVPLEHETIQAAVDEAESGYEIIVDPGTYYENLNLDGKDILLRGRAGSRHTMLDGRSRGSVIMCESGETSACIIEGFTIRNGWGNAHDHTAGGISCKNGSSPTILRNRFMDNHTGCGGGGIICSDGSRSRIAYNHFAFNSAENKGGAIFSISSAPVIEHNVFLNNDGAAGGGAFFAWMGSAMIYNNLMEHNYAQDGGAVGCSFAELTLANNTIAFNEALDGEGAGISLSQDSAGYVSQNIFYGNTGGYGAYVEPGTSSADLSHNAFYADEEGAWSGGINSHTGNIAADPRFCHGPEGYYYLCSATSGYAENSPCIDAGEWNSADIGISRFSTSIDSKMDAGVADLGYHRRGAVRVPADYADIQDALDASWENDRILVSPGTYIGNLEFPSHDVVLESEEGFEKTVLQGINDGAVIRFDEQQTCRTVLKGFTIKNGYGGYGGALSINDSSPLITMNKLIENESLYKGSGMAFLWSLGACISNQVMNNYAQWKGAGVSSNDSCPLVFNNLITQNFAEFKGGALYARDSHLNVLNNTMSENKADQHGGGIFTVDSALVLKNNIIVNSAAGEGLYMEGQAELDSSTNDFWNNAAGDYGGNAAQGTSDIHVNPRFEHGNSMDYCLSTGLPSSPPASPCRDQGDHFASFYGLDQYSTDVMFQPDAGAADLGYHHPDPSQRFLWAKPVTNKFIYNTNSYFQFDLRVHNPGKITTVDLWLVLEIGGEFFFWPGWTEEPDHSLKTLTERTTQSIFSFNFIWPEYFTWNSPITFWTALFPFNPVNLENMACLESVSFEIPG